MDKKEPVGWFDWDAKQELWVQVYPNTHGQPLYAAPPEQEPVAWMEMVVANLVREGVNKHKARELAHHFYTYTAPPSKPWVSLTLKEIEKAMKSLSFGHMEFARTIQDMLKEKNT